MNNKLERGQIAELRRTIEELATTVADLHPEGEVSRVEIENIKARFEAVAENVQQLTNNGFASSDNGLVSSDNGLTHGEEIATPDATPAPANKIVPQTEFGRRLLAIRQRAIDEGMKLLTEEEFEREMAERRGCS